MRELTEIGRSVDDCAKHGTAWCSCKVRQYNDLVAAAGFVVVACPPGGRVVVDRTTKPCEVCGGEGGWEGNDGGGPDFECPSCGGSGVVETTTTYGLEDVELHWNGIEQAIDVYGDGRPEQYDASMPLYRAVALPEETPHAAH